MVEMTPSPSTASLGLVYNAFLFASVADDAAAAPLNTVSVLARLDIDPWREAAELSRLPADSAVQRLAALLVRTPGHPHGLLDAEMIATRLVALLPALKSADGAVAARTTNSGRSFDLKFVAIGFGFAVVVLVSGFFQAANIRTADMTGGKPAAASSAPQPVGSHPDLGR
jgi:hypothetical protein